MEDAHLDGRERACEDGDHGSHGTGVGEGVLCCAWACGRLAWREAV